MDTELEAHRKVTVDPADLRRCFAKLDKQMAIAKPLLERWDELTPKQQRRFENVDALHAPLILRMLPPLTRGADASVIVARSRERRPSSPLVYIIARLSRPRT